MREKRPAGVPEVTRDVLKRRDAARVPAGLFDAGHGSEGPERRPPRLGWRHAGGDVLLHLLIDVGSQLPIEIPVEAALAEERAKAEA